MKKSVMIVGFLVVVVILSVALFALKFNTNREEDTKINDVNQKLEENLGSLCSGEEECRDFCQNNRGRCESFCRGNNIEICSVIFPLEYNKQNTDRQNNEENCRSNPNPVFTHAFVDITKITEISQ
ncbi:MAG: hypothetical protein AABX16_04155 [Nanoarchaeota archaeon]